VINFFYFEFCRNLLFPLSPEKLSGNSFYNAQIHWCNFHKLQTENNGEILLLVLHVNIFSPLAQIGNVLVCSSHCGFPVVLVIPVIPGQPSDPL
jgi:hypothetical protein